MNYKYETHLHTSESSACAVLDAVSQVKMYKELGYTGIIVTDHFFNGNTNIPEDLPWKERVDLFCKGYEHAREEGERIGLDVFFGWEANFDRTEFLIYGLDKEWLLNHPDILNWSIKEQYERVHQDGGLVVHAHPYRIRPYIKEIRLFPEYVDAVEAINAGNGNAVFDLKAILYAREHNLPITAGSDSHGEKGEVRSGLCFHHRLNDIQELITEFKDGKYDLVNIY